MDLYIQCSNPTRFPYFEISSQFRTLMEWTMKIYIFFLGNRRDELLNIFCFNDIRNLDDIPKYGRMNAFQFDVNFDRHLLRTIYVSACGLYIKYISLKFSNQKQFQRIYYPYNWHVFHVCCRWQLTCSVIQCIVRMEKIKHYCDMSSRHNDNKQIKIYI